MHGADKKPSVGRTLETKKGLLLLPRNLSTSRRGNIGQIAPSSEALTGRTWGHDDSWFSFLCFQKKVKNLTLIIFIVIAEDPLFICIIYFIQSLANIFPENEMKILTLKNHSRQSTQTHVATKQLQEVVADKRTTFAILAPTEQFVPLIAFVDSQQATTTLFTIKRPDVNPKQHIQFGQNSTGT